MLGKTDVKVNRPRDGRHCDLCGCSFPAVRCDKCGSQIFCLSCDDMYHRHPKRRFHLRKAVDPTPTPQARPVLPMKVSQLTSSPGDPSKMPLPPPRKKKPGKSFFDSFRRGSPSSDNSPPLPKKEYSWSDRLGSIKKFMSNRPLPPLPKEEDNEEQKISPPVPRKNDLSFIHKRVDEKPPQLPHRMQAKSPPRKHSEGDILTRNQESHMIPEKHADWISNFGAPTNNFQQLPPAPPTQQLNGQASRDSSEREFSSGRFRSKSLQDDMSPTGVPYFPEPPNLSPTMPPDMRGYSTLKRPPTHGQDLHNQSFMSVPGDNFPSMHTSSSVTDIHALDSPSTRGPQQFPNFPIPPHYPHPYPMYPHYPNYPQYFGTSFANLSTVLPSTDGDFSDHSDASSFISKKHKHSSAFGTKAKRSQSVMFDRMAYPPQYYPFGGFPPHPPLPGYGAAPWGQSDHPVEAPPSPATSLRSFGRTHRSRHRKKKMVASDNDEDDDERLSVRSSPRSRTTSSSDRLRRRKTPKKFERSASPSSLTSSEEEEEHQAKEDRLSPEEHTEFSQGDGYQTKQDKRKASKQEKDAGKSEHKTKRHGSKTRGIPHQKLKTDDKNFSPKVKKKEKETLSSNESMDANEEHVDSPKKIEDSVQDQQDAEMKEESDYHSDEGDKKERVMEEPRVEPSLSENQWQCGHCTFINSKENRICQVCCKTKPGSVPQSDAATSLLVPEMQPSSSAAASPILNTTSESLTSDTAKEYLTPPVPAEDDGQSGHSENEGQNFAKLNSDLEQAEKELSRGLMELMKLKEESDIKEASNAQVADRRSPDGAIDRQVLTTQDTQNKTKPVPQTEIAFPQMNDKIETSDEQLNQQQNVSKVESVASKSIGTDAMDFDFSQIQTYAAENATAPAPKPLTSGLFTQDQIPTANSLSEFPASAHSQKEAAGKPTLRRDSSCQTYQGESGAQIDGDVPFLPQGDNIEFQHPHNRADTMRSPQLPPIAPSGYRVFAGRGQGLMHRSHSRSSLFGDRYGDARNVPEFDNLGFGYGPSPMYRSLSRSSLTGDYSDPWMSDVRSLRRPDFYLSMEELVERRRLETKRAQGLELVRMIREAEQQGFTADDIHVALSNCGKQNPVDWLQTNWKGMVDTVVTLATNYGKDKHENDIGVLSDNEARDALRMHKGNIWAAVTECVEGRQRKFLELRARGNFSTKEIVDALTQSDGNVELAYTRLSATTLKPFLMRIWGAGEGVENQDGAVYDPAEFLDPESSEWPKSSTLRGGKVPYGDTERCSDQEDWDDDEDVEDEVSWNEDEEDEVEHPENFNIEPEIIRREKRHFALNNIASPESDSEYCDAFDPVGDARSATSSSPVDEIFFVSPDSDGELQKDKKKGTSFLSRLAALRKNKKPQMEDMAGKDSTNHNPEEDSCDSWEVSDKNRANDSTSTSSEKNKAYGPLNILKQTLSAIKDSVIGSSNKNDAKHPRSITEARTIIVHDKSLEQDSVPLEENAQKGIKRGLKSEPSLQSKHKDEYLPKGTIKPNSKENNLARESSAKTPKSDSENKSLPNLSSVKTDDKVPAVSKSTEKISAKQQRNKHSEWEATTSADSQGILNKEKYNLEPVSLEDKPKEGSLSVVTKSPSAKDVKETVKEEKRPSLDTSEQPQNEALITLKDDIKDSVPATKQEFPKKSEKDSLLTPEKCVAVPEKTPASGLNKKDENSPQVPSPNPPPKSPSNEVDLETNSNSEMDTSLPQVTDRVVNDMSVSNEVVETSAKSPEKIKNSDEKTKTKKQRDLQTIEKTENYETANDQPQLDKEKNESVTKVHRTSTPKIGIHAAAEEKTLKDQSDKVVAIATESRSHVEESENVSQNSKKSEGRHSNDLFQGKPGETNSSSLIKTKESEEKSAIEEKPTNNISENEFHDMASKITEKLENCLEVIKSSEAAFKEGEEATPPHSENREASTSGNDVQSEINSFQSNSETPEVATNIITTDTVKISAAHEEKKQGDVNAKSPSPSTIQSKMALSDDGKQISEKDEVIDSSDKIISVGTAEEHTVQDSKTPEQTSTIKVVLDDKSVVTNASNEVLAYSTSAESPEPQTAPSPLTTADSDKIDEASVEFAVVKAKTFTGLNKKAKPQMYESDKKQEDASVHSPTPKTTLEVTQNDKASTDSKDSSNIKQIPEYSTDIHKGENTKQQSQQGETEKHVDSTTTKEENVPSNEQHSQITSGGQKNESPLPITTEPKEAPSSDVATSESHQEEKNASKTPLATNTAASEPEKEELEAKNSGGQVKEKEKKSAIITTKRELPVFARFSVRRFQDRGIKSTMSVTNRESSGFSERKVTDFKAKEQDTKKGSTAIPANNATSTSESSKSSPDTKNITAEATVPSLSTVSGGEAKEQKETGAKAETSTTGTSADTTNKSADVQVNRQDEQNAMATATIETSIATTEKSTDIKANEEAEESTVAASNKKESVPTVNEGTDIKANEQDGKNTTIAAETQASVSTPSKGTDIKVIGHDVKTATTENEASVASTQQEDFDTKAKEKGVETAVTAASADASVSSQRKDSDIKSEDTDSKKDASATEIEASASFTIKDAGTKTKDKDSESSTARDSTEASVSTPRRRERLRMEIQGVERNSSSNDDSVPSSPVVFGDRRPTSRVEALRNYSNEERENSQGRSQSPIRPQSPFGRMTSLTARKEAIAQERNKEVRKTPTTEKKPWFIQKVQPPKHSLPKRSIKQQLEFERKVRNLVSERKCRTYRKAEVVVQLLELNFAEEEALQAAHECSNLEQAISYLQQECLLCTGMYPVGQIVSMVHCPHKACRECIKAYFTIQIRDRTIMELLCPFCNEPDISDEDVAQDYFNHLDILLKKLVELDIHELFQRKLRDRVLMKDPNFRWCSQCSSGFIAMPNLKRLICPDCNAITCAKCRRPWEREHERVSCEAFAAWKDANDPEAQTAGLAKLLQEDGIECPNCRFRYFLAKGGCMHFRCIQCQHDFCSGCSKPFKMGQKCGVSEFCGKLGLHAHHPRNCLFYLRDKEPEDLQKLLDLNDIEYNTDAPDGMGLKSVCQVLEQKETPDGLVDDICGKEVQDKQAGLCRVHYVEYLGQLVNKHKIDPIQIFCNDDLELVLRRASKRLPAKSYRDSEIKYREKLVQLIQEELPLELTEGS